MHIFQFSFPWREGNGRQGCVEGEIEALRPREHYGEMRGEGECQAWEHHAKVCAHCARSLVAFMDAAGVEIFDDAVKVFGDYQLPDGADHVRMWQLGPWANGSVHRYLVTIEPYHDGYKTVETWCLKHKWQCATMEPGYGMWLPTGEKGTRMLLISPPEVGIDVVKLVHVLQEKMPRWIDE